MPSNGAQFKIAEGRFTGPHILASLNGTIRNAFKEWLISEAQAELDKQVRSKEIYEAVAFKIINQAAAGFYDWEEQHSAETRRRTKGFRYYIWLRLKETGEKIKVEDMEEFLKDMSLKDTKGEVIVHGEQRIQFLLAIADGWVPDPKVLPPLVEGAAIENLEEFAKLAIEKFTATL